ncbi:hypothetical protein JAAARDRAFT_193361 [Jaapia argillacea MUCL 33604]|uniref:FAR1 domain-containing protein n=1 Tax=Jaapia argillacea MUCL 33604 TaxID=933084 RepID=A0A067PSY7_9AGAM|nr:hypothetical protein JAAARDRAFT_193361 [Jaapia argillacea MUCL 33604]
MAQSSFKLNPYIKFPTLSTSTPNTNSVFSEFRVEPDQPTPRIRGYAHSLEKDIYTRKFASQPEALTWMKAEGLACCVEFQYKCSKAAPPEYADAWSRKIIFVCSQGHSGGKSKYVWKNPDWRFKKESKKTGCKAKVTIKIYLNTTNVLVLHTQEHAHPIGYENVKHTQILKETRVRIAEMLRMKISPDKIVSFFLFVMGYQKSATAMLATWFNINVEV